MNNSPSVKRNFLYNSAYQLLLVLTPFITAPYISRVLGADGIGIYSYTSSILAYFTMFSVLGTTQYGIREIARLRDDKAAMSKTFWEIEIIRVSCTFICFSCWLAFSFTSRHYMLYFLALTPMLIASIFDVSWFFSGLERMGYTVTQNTICKIVGIVCLFLFVRTKEDLLLYIVLNSVIFLLGALSMWIYMPRLVNRISLRGISLKRHIRETLTYFIITISISLYTILDKVLIGLITQDHFQNGYYEQANKVICIVESFSFAALNSVMGARLSYLFAQNKVDEIRLRISRSLDFCLLINYGFIFGICSVAQNFVPVFFGEGYEPVVQMLLMKTPLLLFICLSTVLGSHYYVPSGQIKKSTYMTIIGSCINLCANLLFIPLFGATGAILGTLIGEGLIALLYFLHARSIVNLRLLWQFSFKRVLAGMVMLLSAYCVQRMFSGNFLQILIVQIFCATMTYIIILLLLRDSMLLDVIQMARTRIGRVKFKF